MATSFCSSRLETKTSGSARSEALALLSETARRCSIKSSISIPSNLIRISPRCNSRLSPTDIFSAFADIIGPIAAQSSGCKNTLPVDTFLPAASARASIRLTINSGRSSIATPARAVANLTTVACNDCDNVVVSIDCGLSNPDRALSKAFILLEKISSASAVKAARISVSPAIRPAKTPSA